jgi:hypothetical protein
MYALEPGVVPQSSAVAYIWLKCCFRHAYRAVDFGIHAWKFFAIS